MHRLEILLEVMHPAPPLVVCKHQNGGVQRSHILGSRINVHSMEGITMYKMYVGM